MAFPKAVVIVAGGTGNRMGTAIPKQFINLKNKPIIVHTIEQFIQFEKQIDIVVVCHKDFIDKLERIKSEYFSFNNLKIIEGGESRFQSCQLGVAAVANSENTIVAIHDAVRPNISQQVIEDGFNIAKEKGSAIPAVPVVDTIRVVFEDGDSEWINRNQFRKIQTPQCFQLNKLKQAYTNAAATNENIFTDDASVWEADGNKVHLYPGDEKNIKITKPADLLMIEAMLKDKGEES